MKKIIINKQKLPEKLFNYVIRRKIWIDKDNIWKTYYYTDSVTIPEKQLNPEKTIIEYNGSSNKKNVPNPKMHDDMINSSKPIEHEILTVNSDYIGWYEQYHIMLHNWPYSRKPKLDPKTETLKYDFGEDCYNKHATGATAQGYVTYAEMASSIQLKKIKKLVYKHEDKTTEKVFTDELKSLEWYENIFKTGEKPYPDGRWIQGRDTITSITSHVSGLTEDFNKNPDPEHWRQNGYQYHITKDGLEIIIGGNSRGRGFINSSMRNKGMYSNLIPEEYIDVLTQEDLEDFSAWLNRLTTYRQKNTNEETLVLRLYNKVVKGKYLTRKTKDAGCLPKFDHPALLNFFKGYENQLSKNDIKSVKNKVTKRCEKDRAEDVRREEGSIDTSDRGLKVASNKDIWDEKIEEHLTPIEKDLDRTLEDHEKIKSVRGMIGKTIINYLCGLKGMLIRYEKVKGLTDENSVKETKELEGKIGEKKMPHDLVVFVNFETGAKYERFINGGGSGAPEKLQAIQEIASRMIDGRLFIISIDPRIKKS